MTIMTKSGKQLTRLEYLESILKRYERNSYINRPLTLNRDEKGIQTPIQDNGEFILSEKYRAPFNYQLTDIPCNVMVLGITGTGKTHNVVLPNLMQMNGSYIVIDPQEEMLKTTKETFESNGYQVKVLNLRDTANSDNYNPFVYLDDDEDVREVVRCILANRPINTYYIDPFHDKAENALLSAIVFYLLNHRKQEDQNFPIVYNMLRQAQPKPHVDNFELDNLFGDVRKHTPNDYSLRLYETFKLSPAKSANDVLANALNHLRFANEINEIASSDTMNLNTLKDRKTIVYIIPDTAANSERNIMIPILCAQAYKIAKKRVGKAYSENSIKDLQPLCFILDEFANCGIIPNLFTTIQTTKKEGIYSMIILQTKEQLEKLHYTAQEIESYFGYIVNMKENHKCTITTRDLKLEDKQCNI